MICTAKQLLDVAVAEKGYTGKVNNNSLDDPLANITGSFTKYARDLWMGGAPDHYYNGNKNGYAWCCCFVDWCIYTACNKIKADALQVKPVHLYGAGVSWSLKAMDGMTVETPQPGDIFFHKDNSHTGIVLSVDAKNGTFSTIEGNWGKKVASRENLKISDFIFAHPNYAPEEIPECEDCEEDCEEVSEEVWKTIFEDEHIRIQTK